MTSAGSEAGAEPFFLGSGAGQRFCLYHRPAAPCRGALLYVHPFAEELNRSRRMAALQARALAARGWGVLQIDLHGCGDSAGDFGDARWESWKQDLALGAAWLRARPEHRGQPISLWGLRLGALLALDFARGADHQLGTILLWQPVASGSAYLTQFLRLRTANAMLGEEASAQTGTKALREALQSGQTLEIAGYDLAPALALAIDGLAPLEALAPPAPVHWFEVGSAAAPSPAATRIQAAWEARGLALRLHAVQGLPFWATTEIATCPALVEATIGALEEPSHAL